MRCRRCICGTLLLAGCVIGVRGEAAFEGAHDLSTVRELRLDLPSTPIDVFACDAGIEQTCPDELRYVGRWRTIGGTRADARRRAEQPALVFERLDGVAELRAEVPLSVRGTVDLAMDEITMPDDRPLDIQTDLGDVHVFGMSAPVVIDVGVGDVEVVGGDDGIGVWTDLGDVRVAADGPVDVAVGKGSIEVIQTGGARDLHLRTDHGNVTIELADDSDLDLTVSAPGDIWITTENIAAITHGRFSRRTGDGTIRMVIHTGHGSVTIRRRGV